MFEIPNEGPRFAPRNYADENYAMKQRIAVLEAENATLREQYNDLIMQVQQKHPDETRHETAKRYIYNAEHQDNPPASALEADDE